MQTPTETVIRVVHRQLRWEVAVNGVTRPLVDWTYSRERAVEHALEYARELGVPLVAVEQWDGTVEEWIASDGQRVSRLSLVA